MFNLSLKSKVLLASAIAMVLILLFVAGFFAFGFYIMPKIAPILVDIPILVGVLAAGCIFLSTVVSVTYITDSRTARYAFLSLALAVLSVSAGMLQVYWGLALLALASVSPLNRYVAVDVKNIRANFPALFT